MRAHHVGTGPVLMIVVVLILVPPIPTVQAVFPIRVCVHCEKRTRKTTFSFLFYCIGLANATHSKGVYIQVYAARSNDLIFGHVNKNKEEKGMLIQYMQIGYPVLQVLQLLLHNHSYISDPPLIRSWSGALSHLISLHNTKLATIASVPKCVC